VAWWDGWAALDSRGFGQGQKTFQPATSQRGFSIARNSSNSFDWGGSGGAAKVPKPKAAEFPEKINFAAPFSSKPAPAAPQIQPVKGDWFASLNESLSKGNFDLANFVPHFQEIPSNLLHGLEDTHVPGISQAAGGAAWAVDRVLDVSKAVSDTVEPVLNAVPNWYRDSQLGDRAKVYAAMTKGQQAPSDWTMTGDLFGSLYGLLTDPTGLGRTIAMAQGKEDIASSARDTADRYNNYLNTLGHALDPDQRLNAQTKIAMLKDSLDLPASVKQALDNDPLADFNKLLDEAPEGRQFSYRPEMDGMARNIGTPLIFYAPFMRAGMGTTKTISTLTDVLRAPGAVGPFARPALAAVQGITVASKVSAAAMAAGMGTYGLVLAQQTKARYDGNQAAVDWWDNITRTTEYSDDPRVQLVTSFAVNPFQAAGFVSRGAKAAAMPFVKGGDIMLGRSLGDRYVRTIGPAEQVDRILGAMHQLQPAEVPDFLDRHFPNPEDRAAAVLQLAADYVVNPPKPGGISAFGVTSQDRMAMNAAFPDAGERVIHVLQKYPTQIREALKDPKTLAGHFQYAWDRMNTGTAFNPEVMAQIGAEYRAMDAQTFKLRQQLGAVLGYREHVTPAAVQDIRSRIAAMTAPDGTVPIAAKRFSQDDSWQQLTRNYPALKKFWQGLLKGEDRVPAATLNEIVDRAEADWATTMRQNPVRATTGTDPILRPNASMRDYADALGTDEATVAALQNEASWKDAADLDLLRKYLTEREFDVPAEPEAIWQAAYKHMELATAPWEGMGAAVVKAEADQLRLRDRLNELDAQRPTTPAGLKGDLPPDLALQHDVVSQQLTDVRRLLRIAGDPITPFAESTRVIAIGQRRVTRTFDERMAEAARQKVIAQETLTELSALDQAMTDTVAAALPREAGVHWTKLLHFDRDAGFTWGGGADPIPYSIRLKLAKFVHPGNPEAAVRDMLVGEGMPGLYGEIRLAGGPFRATLKPGETRFLDGANDGIAIGEVTAGGASTTADIRASEVLINDLIRGADERARLLSGESLSTLERRAAKEVQTEYLAMARDELSGLYLDPELLARQHPSNIATWMKALDGGLPVEALTRGPETDPIITGQLVALAESRGQTLEDLIHDQTAYAAIREAIVPADFEPPTPGQLRPMTTLDDQLLSSDADVQKALAESQDTLLAAREAGAPPVAGVSTAEWEAVRSRWAIERISSQWRARLDALGADLSASPSEGVMAAAENAVGMKVINVLNHGPKFVDHNPATIRGLLALQRSIEDGSATRMGLGQDLQAEGQRVIRALLDDAAKTTKQAGIEGGVFTTGVDPAMFPDEWWKVATELFEKHPTAIVDFDPTAPLEAIRYGLKKPPSTAVVMEWSSVPGLAEEFLTDSFAPFSERLGSAQIRQAYNFIFGPRANTAVGSEAKARFTARLANNGIGTEEADAVWAAWHDATENSPRVFDEFRVYGTVRNIPNSAMNRIARAALEEHLSKADPLYRRMVLDTDLSREFREASSFIRRHLADSNLPLGEVMASMYGKVAHNAWVTTWYYVFRFGLDIRFHAQNFVEPYVLGAGRAGLKAPLREAYLGQTQGMLTRLGEDAFSDTGYLYMGGTRAKIAYRTFLAEQDQAMTKALRGIDAENPGLMEKALTQMAKDDHELRATIAVMGDTPETWMKLMDDHYKKFLGTRSDEEVGQLLAADFEKAMAESPQLAEVYSRLQQVNAELWHDIRGTFYGNAERSNIERVLNHYLLFWPISYQIKATKWLTKVLFDSVGGLPTNAAGAYALDGVVKIHNQQLATDPKYRDWFEKHETLLFIASMLLPIDPSNIGVSMNPGLRSMFMGRSKAWWNIGPIYTLTDLGPKALGELYPHLSGVPGLDGLYRAATGMEPGQQKITVGKKAPIDDFTRN
jgi:hypothetical protein